MKSDEFNTFQDAVETFAIKYISCILQTGKYHGDPHAGNVKWHWDDSTKKGKLGPLDFGDWKTIDTSKQLSADALGKFLKAVSIYSVV